MSKSDGRRSRGIRRARVSMVMATDRLCCHRPWMSSRPAGLLVMDDIMAKLRATILTRLLPSMAAASCRLRIFRPVPNNGELARPTTLVRMGGSFSISSSNARSPSSLFIFSDRILCAMRGMGGNVPR